MIVSLKCSIALITAARIHHAKVLAQEIKSIVLIHVRVSVNVTTVVTTVTIQFVVERILAKISNYTLTTKYAKVSNLKYLAIVSQHVKADLKIIVFFLHRTGNIEPI